MCFGTQDSCHALFIVIIVFLGMIICITIETNQIFQLYKQVLLSLYIYYVELDLLVNELTFHRELEM